MRKFITLYAVLCMCVYSVTGQTVNDVLNKMNATLTGASPVHYNTKYNLYRDAKSKIIYESYSGQFQKTSANEVYMKIDNTEFVNTGKRALRVNHKQKAILIMDPQPITTGDFDMKKLAELCKITSFKDYKSFWEIIFVPNEFSGLTYSRIQLIINKNYTVSKQVFFYNTGLDFSKDYRKSDVSQPRLEILYSKYDKNLPDVNKLKNDFFISFNKQNKAIPSGNYKNYKIVDKRTLRK
jgi:hypothetical protein